MKYNRKLIRFSLSFVCLLAAILTSFTYYLFNGRNGDKATGKYDYVNGSYVEFLDVGQADCALIASRGKHCLIDAGNADDYSAIRDELRNKGIRTIDLIIISHYHADHTGALQSIVNNFSVSNLIYPPEYGDTSVSNDVLYAKKECIAEDGEFYVAKTGQTVDIGDFKLTVLLQTGELSGENNRSLYIMAKIGDKKFFFTGDGETEEESLLLKQGYDLDCDVLKVAHHGGRTSSTEAFLGECKPEYAVISCAKKNRYKHPHKETLDRLKKAKAKIFRTYKSGDITFVYEDGKLSVMTEK